MTEEASTVGAATRAIGRATRELADGKVIVRDAAKQQLAGKRTDMLRKAHAALYDAFGDMVGALWEGAGLGDGQQSCHRTLRRRRLLQSQTTQSGRR